MSEELVLLGNGRARLGNRNLAYAVRVVPDGTEIWLDGRTYKIESPAAKSRSHQSSANQNQLEASMPGTILDIKAAVGEAVKAGDVLVLMESMKMEMTLEAPRDGTVAEVLCQKGQRVELGAVLVRLT